MLRRVGYRHPETGTTGCWTTAFPRAATTMAAIDTARWPLELCCKAITQHLTIKTCVGLSENAVMSPIWVALIVLDASLRAIPGGPKPLVPADAAPPPHQPIRHANPG